MINVIKIRDLELNNILEKFEKAMHYVQSLEYPIKLNSYGYFLRLALNGLQSHDLDYIIFRLKNNKDLERNEGGYSMDYLGENNPKSMLLEFLNYIKTNLPKTKKLENTKIDYNCILIADQNDCDFLKNSFWNVYTIKELKIKLKTSSISERSKLFFYTFNGQKDFDFLFNLPHEINLVLYPSEIALYKKHQQEYRKKLEEELISDDRYKLCGLKYIPFKAEPIVVSPTLEKIIQYLDERSQTAYNGYSNECDSLLDELNYKIQYEILFSNNTKTVLESNETVFDLSGNLLRARLLKPNDKIRIYPKELAENLLQIAVDLEPEIYGKVLEYSEFWLKILVKLDETFNNREHLYNKLREAGLKVQYNTVDAYFKGHRKYPMYNSDLRAILLLGDREDLVNPMIKSKRLYNSTTIALGRGLKQELKQFLQEKKMGEILTKRNFSPETLSRFIFEKMPLLTISDIKEREDENEN